MPDFTPLDPGDVPYPQYSVITTMPVSAIAIVKGVIYTVNLTSGQLEVIDAAADLAQGIFQAMADIEVAGLAGENEVQVLGPRTRMLLNDTVGGLTIGQDVNITVGTSNIVAGDHADENYMGKVFEIYSVNADSTKKTVSESGDTIIVETVQR